MDVTLLNVCENNHTNLVEYTLRIDDVVSNPNLYNFNIGSIFKVSYIKGFSHYSGWSLIPKKKYREG